jgi:hypothetical protein
MTWHHDSNKGGEVNPRVFFKYDGYFSREADAFMTAVKDKHNGPWVCSSGTGRALCCGTSKLRCLRTAMYIVDGRRTPCRRRPLCSTETPAALRVILLAKIPRSSPLSPSR